MIQYCIIVWREIKRIRHFPKTTTPWGFVAETVVQFSTTFWKKLNLDWDNKRLESFNRNAVKTLMVIIMTTALFIFSRSVKLLLGSSIREHRLDSNELTDALTELIGPMISIQIKRQCLLSPANKVEQRKCFTDVCLSVHMVGGLVRPLPMEHLAFKVESLPVLAPIQTWDTRTLSSDPSLPPRDIWRPIPNCSLDLTVQEKYCPHQYWRLVATKVCMVGKQVVWPTPLDLILRS